MTGCDVGNAVVVGGCMTTETHAHQHIEGYGGIVVLYVNQSRNAAQQQGSTSTAIQLLHSHESPENDRAGENEEEHVGDIWVIFARLKYTQPSQRVACVYGLRRSDG